MTNAITIFLENLIDRYRKYAVINYVSYDGTTAPCLEQKVPHFTKGTLEDDSAVEWVSDYLSGTDNVHYYEMYKKWMKDNCHLWVNPSLEELENYNETIGLNASCHLDKKITYDKCWIKQRMKHIRHDLEKDGYAILTGREIIERLVQLYDRYCFSDISFVDWVKPIDISRLNNCETYVVDKEVLAKPLPFDEPLLVEQDNREMPVNKDFLGLYFDHLLVTKRGLTSLEITQDKKIDVFFHQDIDDYLCKNQAGRKEEMLRKLYIADVDVTQPFLEIVTDRFGEMFCNQTMLKTEKDILNFVNLAYVKEEVDREAKSFDRKKILEAMMADEFTEKYQRDYSQFIGSRSGRND